MASLQIVKKGQTKLNRTFFLVQYGKKFAVVSENGYDFLYQEGVKADPSTQWTTSLKKAEKEFKKKIDGLYEFQLVELEDYNGDYLKYCKAKIRACIKEGFNKFVKYNGTSPKSQDLFVETPKGLKLVAIFSDDWEGFKVTKSFKEFEFFTWM